MTGLVLDENISPALVSRLWSEGVDSWHVRDRGLLQVSDYRLFSIAQNEKRSVVTINAGHFRRLCCDIPSNYGVLAIPSGGTRDQQFEYISAGIGLTGDVEHDLSRLTGRFTEVCEAGRVKVDMSMSKTAKIVSLPRRRLPGG